MRSSARQKFSLEFSLPAPLENVASSWFVVPCIPFCLS
jgi:hypothetical protein